VVQGSCQNIEIRNNDISQVNFSTDPDPEVNYDTNSYPLLIYGTGAIQNVTIDGNTVHDSQTGFSEGIAVNGNVDGFDITNNLVYNISNIGIDAIGHEGTASVNDQARNGTIKGNVVRDCKSPYATSAGIYVDGATDVIIENNEVYNCQWGIEVGCENADKTTSDITVRNNFIYNNDDAGIAIGGFNYPFDDGSLPDPNEEESGKVIDCSIINNSCYNNDKIDGSIGGESGELSISYTENCTIANNIFYTKNNDLVNLGRSENLTLDYNLYYKTGVANYGFISNQDANSSYGDPQFISTSTPDLHLSSNSPAIDNGDDSVEIGSTDFDGDSRVQGGTVDIGASVNGIATITNIDPLPNYYDVTLVQRNVLVEQGETYEVTFRARADENRQLELEINLNSGLYTTYHYEPVSLSSNWEVYTIDFTMTSPTDNNANFGLYMGGNTTNIYIDNVSLQKVDCEGESSCPEEGDNCDDGNVCTTGSTVDADCNCTGGNYTDADGDGVCVGNDPNDNDPCVPNACPSDQSAYPSGVPHSIPGIINATDYDDGGEGIAYHDTSNDNKGMKLHQNSAAVNST